MVFTWGWTGGHPVPPGTTRVIVTLAEEDGGTRVVLRHLGLPTDEQRGQHRTGWELYLDRLRIRVGGGDPGPDPQQLSGGEVRRSGSTGLLIMITFPARRRAGHQGLLVPR